MAAIVMTEVQCQTGGAMMASVISRGVNVVEIRPGVVDLDRNALRSLYPKGS